MDYMPLERDRDRVDDSVISYENIWPYSETNNKFPAPELFFHIKYCL